MPSDKFMRQAIDLSRRAIVEKIGGPFGAIVVHKGIVIASGQNRVLLENDPTAHAEIIAIRSASHHLGAFRLTGCELYTSCEPCPMCLGAIYWARIERVYYANTRADAAKIGFDDEFIYTEFGMPAAQRCITFKQFLREKAIIVFDDWSRSADKRLY